MSRRRSNHQTSRRRMYRTRQHQLGERRTNVAREADDWLPAEVAALDIEESVGMDSPTVEHPAG